MAEDWEAIAGEVADALEDTGFTVTLRKPVAGGPATPWDATAEPTPDDYTLNVVLTHVDKKDQSGTLIGETKRVLIAESANGVVPHKDDKVFIDSVWTEINNVKPLAPGGVDLMYEIELEN